MRILIAEDDPISCKVLEATLKKWGYEVEVTRDGQEAWERLQAPDAPKLAVVDWMMPKLAGPDVCKSVRAMPGGEYFYMLLLTAQGTKDNIVEGLDAGADDYLIKPFDPRELKVRIRCGQRIVDLQAELVKTRDKLKIQATHDVLTGVLNRAAIFEVLQREQARAIRKDLPLTVIMADLDHFKAVNDTFGHGAGDIVLREATRRISQNVRQYDTLGRYGGEEFLIVLPDGDSEVARGQAERICRCIAEEPFDIGDQKIPITLSMGLASSDIFGLDDTDELVKLADHALYQAKEAGRNRAVAASAELACQGTE
jgi:diguanylate cyclase (GGDEF)-like protein